VLHVRVRSHSFPAADNNGAFCTAATHATGGRNESNIENDNKTSDENDVDTNISDVTRSSTFNMFDPARLRT
jgi:hypothetical protein